LLGSRGVAGASSAAASTFEMDIAGNRFLVTGGSGFIGSHVVDRLLAEGAGEVVVFDSRPRPENLDEALESGRVRIVEGDVTAPASIAEAMAGAGGVFHMAVLPLGPCSEDPRRCLDVNVVGTFNVLEAAREAGVQKIVFSSASSVYGDTNETMDESHPLNARTMYGASKIAGEYFVHALCQLYGLDYVILRYMNVYGPRQEGGLVINVLNRIRSGEQPTIMGDGSASFDFVHVADIASANVRAMSAGVSGASFNVGGGNEVSVREIVDRLLELTGSDLEPDVRADVDVPMTRRVGSSERAMSDLDWRPEFDLEHGLGDVVAKAR
jgi:nucleoside-diphosphate-sugar epimerase